MKFFYLILIVPILFLGCVTPVRVKYGVNVEEGVYALPIAIEYAENPEKLKYAVNLWVKEQGFTSYDLEVRKFENMANCYVTIPGSTPVEDLPPIKHVSAGRTVALILPVTVVALNIIFQILASSGVFSGGN